MEFPLGQLPRTVRVRGRGVFEGESSRVWRVFLMKKGKGGINTQSVHAGCQPDPQFGGVSVPIYQSSTFVFQDANEGAEIFSGERSGYAYTRLGNPTVMLLEAKMNALEGQEAKLRNPDLRVSTLAFSSGMSAMTGRAIRIWPLIAVPAQAAITITTIGHSLKTFSSITTEVPG